MSNKLFLRFSGYFIVYLVIILGLAAFPLYKFADYTIIVGVFANTGLFFGVTLLSFYLIIRAAKKKGAMVNAFLAGTVIKLLLALVYLMFFLKDFPGHEVEFALTFFAAYLICTVFEVYYILYNLRQI